MTQLWHCVETRPLIWSWHLDVITEHLEAQTDGEIKNLIINVPPGMTKSMTVCVFWPAWEWLKRPETRWMFFSYADTLVLRDARRCRLLIQSPEYQSIIAYTRPEFELAGDQNAKREYINSYHGARQASTVKGVGTGLRGDRIVVDDPHNVQKAESEAERLGVLSWWDESISTRIDDRGTGSRTIIMQRVHHNDLVGHVLERAEAADNWVHVKIPMHYTGMNQIVSPLGMEDPREEEGELLCPERFDKEAVAEMERDLGRYGTAAQMQQEPTPREGGMFLVKCLRYIPTINRQQIAASVRYWDKAGTEGGGARTAGVLMHRMVDSCPYRYVVEDVVAGQWGATEREKIILATAQRDAKTVHPAWGIPVETWMEQEPGSGGKESAQNTIRNLAGFPAFAETASGKKEERAGPFASQMGVEGNVALVVGEWNRSYVEELQQFPMGKYLDKVDGSSGAFNRLEGLREEAVEVGIWGRRDRGARGAIRRRR